MNSLKKNFLYNIIYQILILIIPLITVPYVSRTIGAEGIGVYSYTYSIVYYFMLLAMLGLNNYGNRSIAKVRDNKEKLSKTFKEIYLMQFATSTIMIVCYSLYIYFFNINYEFIAFIQIISLISCVFDINWFFFGIEKFKITVTRNTIIKIISLILIFTFVKSSSDLWKYALIISTSTLLSQIILWPFVKRYVNKCEVDFKGIISHLKPSLILFLPVIAVAIYKIMDKTMLGSLSQITEVGFYENAEKVINIPNAIIAALGTVMLPRMSNMYANGQDKESKELIEKSISLMMFLAFAMCFGLIAISKDFSILFFGSEFAKSGILIILLSVTILFLSWGNVIRTQFLIPKEKDNIYIISAFLGAIVNFIMNSILIPKYASIGACYGTIAAEFIVMFYQTFSIKNELPIKKYLYNILPFFIKALIMFGLVMFIGKLNFDRIYVILLQVLIGFVTYFILNYKYINSIIDLKKFINKIVGVKHE